MATGKLLILRPEHVELRLQLPVGLRELLQRLYYLRHFALALLDLFLQKLIALRELVQLIPLLLVVELHLLDRALHVLNLTKERFFVGLRLLRRLSKDVDLLLDLGELTLLLLDVGLDFPFEFSISELMLLDFLFLRLDTHLIELLLLIHLFLVMLQIIFQFLYLPYLILDCLLFGLLFIREIVHLLQ